MKKSPLPVIIIAILFILVGIVGFAYHVKELFAADHNGYETIWILLLRIIAVACGVLLLKKVSWARWLAIAWLAYHIIIGALNSIGEMIIHAVFLLIVSILLFLPVSSAYFKNKRQL